VSATWLRITGKDRWVPTQAIVYSCDYTGLPNQINPEVGHHHVTYSYAVADEVYTGRFVDYGKEDEEYFKPGDTFEVRYDPRHPSKSYYPDLRTQTSFRLICFAIGAVLGIVTIILYAIAQYRPH
jgi:hypothetical protein